MDEKQRQLLLSVSRAHVCDDDPSHDFEHHCRVAVQGARIAKAEGARVDLVFAAALFHDLVNHPKNSPRAKDNAWHSSILASEILMRETRMLPADIEIVRQAIAECSFSRGMVPTTLEGRVLADADKLESTGLIAVMRTCASSGQMKRRFYDAGDPFHETDRKLDPFQNMLDLFPSRLFLVMERLHTETAKRMAEARDKRLRAFHDELCEELSEIYDDASLKQG